MDLDRYNNFCKRQTVSYKRQRLLKRVNLPALSQSYSVIMFKLDQVCYSEA